MDLDLVKLIDGFARLKALIIGEAMLDSYLDGVASRISSEAPVPIIAVSGRTDAPGGAANTAANARALGADVTFLSVIGNDQEGKSLCDALQSHGLRTDHVLVQPGRRTIAKQRIMASSHMLLRFDQGSTEDIDARTERKFLERLDNLFPHADAVIVSDYAYGLLTPRIIARLRQLQAQAPRTLVVDSKRLGQYREVGVTAVKPNYEETLRLLEMPTGGERLPLDLLTDLGDKVLDATGAHLAAVTLDSDGALLFEPGVPPYRTYAQKVRNPQAAGAGDTFVAALALGLASGMHGPAAAEVASAASSVVVAKEGTSISSALELRARLTWEGKHVDQLTLLSDQAYFYRQQGKRVVFTNGVFDIVHRGHVTYLSQAKSLGDILVVAVNSDESVRRLKGPLRPINSLEDRIQVLAALSCVDYIIAFDEDTPAQLISAIKPDVYVKGGDYTRETLPEASLVESLGGRVHILPYVEERSTTGIIERITLAYAKTG